jgi:phosphoglycerate dehydrogenase-like enzyme
MLDDLVAVCSRSFSKNPILRAELQMKYRNVKFNDQGLELKGETLIQFLKGYEKAIIALEKINENILASLPDLKVISKYGVGLDMIEFPALKKYGIKLGWEGGVNKRSVAELALAFALTILRKLPVCNNLIKSGGFNQIIGEQLTGKVFGIIGCGNVGKELVNLLTPFKVNLYVYDKIYDEKFCLQNNIEFVSLDNLLSKSDIISLHIPLDNSTENLINKQKLSLLKKNAILINTARGGLVDELELKNILINNKIAGAAFDVFSSEPLIDLELLQLPNFFGTPHIGGSTIESILAMGRSAINGLEINDFIENMEN